MTSPSSASAPPPCPAIQLQGNHWMMLAISSLALLAAWNVTQNLAARGQTLQLTLFMIGTVGYFLNSTDLSTPMMKRFGIWSYFILQFFCLGLIIYAGWNAGPVWLLTLPVASQAIFFLPARAVWPVLIAIFATACLSLLDLRGSQILYGALNIFSSFFFTVGCSWAIRREHATRAELQDAHEKLRIYANNIEALAIAEERNRLAREIHDGVAHHLTASNVLLAAGQALLPAETAAHVRDPLQKAQGQIRAALVDLRESIETRHLRSTALPLGDRIRALIADGNFPAELQVVGQPRPLSPSAEQAFFRVAQEALTNARKHAPGSQAKLRLDYTHAGQTTLRVENPETQTIDSGDGAFGLLSLRQRMQQLGGTFQAGAEPSGLFVVQAEIPV